MTVGIWVMRTGRPALDAPSVVAILLLGVMATRLSARGRRPKLARLALTILAVASTAAVALFQLPVLTQEGDPAPLLSRLLDGGDGTRVAVAAGFAVFLWWRALGLGRLPMSLELVEEEFQAGTIATTTLLVFVALAGKASMLSPEPLLVAAFAVVSAGLVGMPLARVVDVSRAGGGADGTALKLGGPWLTMLLAVVAGLLAATLLLAQLLTFDRVSAVWESVADPVGAALQTALYLLAMPFGLLTRLLIFLASLLPSSVTARPRKQGNDLPGLDQMQQAAPVALSPEAVFAMKVALAVGLATLVVWMIGRAMARFRRGWDWEEVEEAHDFVWSWPGPSELWRWLLERWRPLRARALAGWARSPTATRRSDSVRGLYREFLDLGAALGRGRAAAETPLEYERRLSGDPLLGGRDEVRSLTDGYNRERYGPPSARLPALLPLALALARLRSLWQGRA
jgi:hypothetical protein